MAKLILKQQDSPKGSWLNHYGSQVAYAGFIALLLIIALGILFTFKSTPVVAVQAAPVLDSATDAKLKATYLSDWAKLTEMQASYEQLAKTAGSHEQALALLNQAEMAWQHLLIMTEATEKLGLNAQDKQKLEAEHAYQQDQWLARIHFSELRVDRFSGQATTALPTDTVKSETASTDTVAATTSNEVVNPPPVTDVLPNSKYIAPPPAGVKLPAGFCTLNGSGVCKPEAAN